MFMEVFLEEKYAEKRKKIPRKCSNYQKSSLFCKMKGLGVFIGQNWPFAFRRPLVVLALSNPASYAYLKAFPNSN